MTVAYDKREGLIWMDGKLINWLLNQDEVQMINAKIIWIDKRQWIEFDT